MIAKQYTVKLPDGIYICNINIYYRTIKELYIYNIPSGKLNKYMYIYNGNQRVYC